MEPDSVITQLTGAQCWDVLRANEFGRLAVGAAGEIDIFPINYVADEGSLVFRTAPGTKLLELTVHENVAFEIDGHSDSDAWSVVVKGRAHALELQSEVDAADALPLTPWIPTLKYRFVRIVPTEVTGRRFVRGPEPERD